MLVLSSRISLSLTLPLGINDFEHPPRGPAAVSSFFSVISIFPVRGRVFLEEPFWGGFGVLRILGNLPGVAVPIHSEGSFGILRRCALQNDRGASPGDKTHMSFPERSDGNLRRLCHGDPCRFIRRGSTRSSRLASQASG